MHKLTVKVPNKYKKNKFDFKKLLIIEKGHNGKFYRWNK